MAVLETAASIAFISAAVWLVVSLVMLVAARTRQSGTWGAKRALLLLVVAYVATLVTFTD